MKESEVSVREFRILHDSLLFEGRGKNDLLVFLHGGIATIKSEISQDKMIVCKVVAMNRHKAISAVAYDWPRGLKPKHYDCNRVKGTTRCLRKKKSKNCPIENQEIFCRCRHSVN